MKYFLLLFLVGCAPVQTYEEISDEAVITGDNTKLEKFEQIAERAYRFREQEYACETSKDVVWMCSESSRRGKAEPETIDEIVRHYRRYHLYCNCVRVNDLWRELGR